MQYFLSEIINDEFYEMMKYETGIDDELMEFQDDFENSYYE